MMKDVYAAILDSLKSNRPSVLATIVGRSGFSARRPGAKMLIMDDGVIAGSVGGGVLEKTVVGASSEVFSSLSPISLKSDPELSCGGDVEVFLEPLLKNDKTGLDVFKEVVDIIRRGGSGLFVTALDTRMWEGGHAAVALFKPSGEKTGFLPIMEEIEKIVMAGMGSFLSQGLPEIITCNDKDGNEFRLFLEPILSAPVLYVFGAGHVSAEVVPLARRVGFKAIVIDDRPEFSDPINFPDAEKVFYYSYDGVISNLSIYSSSYIVIMTRSHSCDQTVLGQALHTDAGYIGMIGSSRKISTIFGNLLEEGFTREDFKRVHTPIGLAIGAETPQEIALSIVAELVKVRAGKVEDGCA
jgi:xanthine dehydrogenase accessory factor